MTYPKIRFRGFSKEWERTSYKEIASSFQYGLNAPATTYDGINKYLRITDIDESLRFFSKSQLTTPSANLLHCDNYLLNSGNIVFARTGASVGKSYIYNEKDGKVYFAGFLIRMTPKINVDPHFVFQNTLTDKFEDHVRLVSQRSGQPGINVSDLQSYQFYIAPDSEEQKRISDYLCAVDSQLKECINNILSLKQIKSACLQSMFPQEGESVPKVRFKGFDKKWIKYTLSNIFIERHEISTITDTLPQLSFTISEGIIRPENRKSNKRDFLIKDKENKKYLVTYIGDIIYNPANVVYGAIHRNSLCNGVVSPIYKIFSTEQDSKFMECIVRNPKFISSLSMKTEGTVTKLKTLKPEDFLEMEVMISPNLEEQQKIAAYFKNLDKQISLQTQRLEKLKQIKSACLDKMFV